jgi:hypothetical protein
MPVINVTYQDGTSASVGSSGAVQRFIANTYGLMGSNAVEAAVVDMVCEHMDEIKKAYADLSGDDKASDLPSTLPRTFGFRPSLCSWVC